MRLSIVGWHALVAVAFTALVTSTPASARPGTPNNVTLYQCFGYIDLPRRLDAPPPAVCVTFRNTAKELVTFEAELKINGAPVSLAEIQDKVRCMLPTGEAQNCVAGLTLAFPSQKWQVQVGKSGTPWGSILMLIPGVQLGALPAYWADPSVRKRLDRKKGGDRPSEAFAIRHLDYDTEYCMRFRTRDDDDTVSLLWSNWGCTRTKAVPPPPPPPTKPTAFIESFPETVKQVTVDGTRRTITVPETIKFTWAYGSSLAPATHASVTFTGSDGVKTAEGQPMKFNTTNTNVTGNVEFELEKGGLGNAIFEGLVCVYNVSGKACAKADTGIYAKPKTPGDVDYGQTQDWPKPRTKLPKGDFTTGPVVQTSPGDVGGATKPPNSSPSPSPVDPYVGAPKPKGSSTTPGGIFARPKGPKSVSDVMADPAPPPSDDIYLRSAQATANFTATWNTATAAGARYTMTLNQTGADVTGTYASVDGAVTGTLSGTVAGGTLTYRWQEGASVGMGKFKLGDDGASFTGWWNSSATDANAVSGAWNGTRR
jgi:hypothetical protein